MENKKIATLALGLWMTTALSGCTSLWDKIQDVPNGPQLSSIENPIDNQDYKPVSMPMPTKSATYASGAKSLWKQGSTGFFKDQRAAKIGDIITVKVATKDAATMQNDTQAKRDQNKDTLSVAGLFGFETKAKQLLPGAADPNNAINIQSDREVKATGKIDRKEDINVTMAATVTQVLPNGNLVILGTQEIKVNTELRQLSVKGIVRRADIGSDNSVDSSKIAELRVSYGGKGSISDIQQPRYGSQILDIVSPF